MRPPNYPTPESVVAKLNEIEELGYIQWQLTGKQGLFFKAAYAEAQIPVDQDNCEEPDGDVITSWFPDAEWLRCDVVHKGGLTWLQFSIRD